jgi:hypothetical protein
VSRLVTVFVVLVTVVILAVATRDAVSGDVAPMEPTAPAEETIPLP